MNEDDDQQGTAPNGTDGPERQESIWTTLDGSTPVRPQPEASPLTFTKPEPRPLTFPAPPAPAAQQAAGPWPADRPVFVLATWWARAGAWILDNLLFGILISFVTIPLALALGMTVEEATFFLAGGDLEPPDSVTQPALAYALLALQILGPPIIAAAFLLRWAGQTPGKRATGVRVVTEDGAPLTFGRALLRELVWKTMIIVPLAGITFFVALLANYLWPLRDPQNRAGQDFFAKTRVVTAPKR